MYSCAFPGVSLLLLFPCPCSFVSKRFGRETRSGRIDARGQCFAGGGGDSVATRHTGENLAAGAETRRRRLWDATTVLSSSYLTGSNGVFLPGPVLSDYIGRGGSIIGDVNNDGVDDFVLGGTDQYAYVIFGRDWKSSSFPAEMDLSSLDGTNGFRVDGISSTHFGIECSGGGDFNKDGIADFLIGAPNRDAGGNTNNGELYMIFGRTSWSATVSASALSGSDGVIFRGVGNNVYLGRGNANAGDVNGDRIDDVFFSAYGADQPTSSAGSVFVYFGKTIWSSPIVVNTMDGVVGFRINGEGNDDTGVEVAGNFDINNDGIKDLIFGACCYDAITNSEGRVHVFYGKSSSSFSATYSVTDIDGTNGISISGVLMNGRFGTYVAGLGDVNGDGIDDFIAGAWSANPDSVSQQGDAVVIFGSTDFSALDATDGSVDGKWSVSAFDGSNGFRFYGTAVDDKVGIDVHGPGDVNGDGVNDILIGAEADPNGMTDAGEVYLIYGRKTASGNFAAVLRPSQLDGTNGVVFQGAAASDFLRQVGGGQGDVNKDGE
uniref:Uncharacterized protein n=1 Tax=Chromera velia CCMP2878 TaxID=1169474 RepID=A0A0G4H4W2_9ALVE|eukprot:Cvel_24684.t1-p1 / transcript=Cvel_24684.t1 / gene=Cvel_24684 / organism=Chromera_velia_CCMP2878 / gene_product=Integrin alpha pat-2, putative / transcript_product=Integrin alpha pat-2, putative / location=Cvel_scaffold2704:1703-6104(-) / protein_length=546 / sequence_SO=supercontig / SO=protein_coding / is_pseudo=false